MPKVGLPYAQINPSIHHDLAKLNFLAEMVACVLGRFLVRSIGAHLRPPTTLTRNAMSIERRAAKSSTAENIP